jgi:hypothetical protein
MTSFWNVASLISIGVPVPTVSFREARHFPQTGASSRRFAGIRFLAPQAGQLMIIESMAVFSNLLEI